MFDRIIATIALAFFAYLEKRIERGSTATDAHVDRVRLRRAGTRIREWMQSNSTGSRRKPSEDGK